MLFRFFFFFFFFLIYTFVKCHFKEENIKDPFRRFTSFFFLFFFWGGGGGGICVIFRFSSNITVFCVRSLGPGNEFRRNALE